MSFGYPYLPHPAQTSSGNRSRRNPHRPSSTPSFLMMRPKEELTDTPAVPTFIEKFEAGRSFEMEDDFAFIPELCTEEEVWAAFYTNNLFTRIMLRQCAYISPVRSARWWTTRLQIVLQPQAVLPNRHHYSIRFNPQQRILTLPPMQTCSTTCMLNINNLLLYLQNNALLSPSWILIPDCASLLLH